MILYIEAYVQHGNLVYIYQFVRPVSLLVKKYDINFIKSYIVNMSKYE